MGANTNFSLQLASCVDRGEVQFEHLTFRLVQQASQTNSVNTQLWSTVSVLCVKSTFSWNRVTVQLWKYLSVIYSSEDVTYEDVCILCCWSHKHLLFCGGENSWSTQHSRQTLISWTKIQTSHRNTCMDIQCLVIVRMEVQMMSVIHLRSGLTKFKRDWSNPVSKSCLLFNVTRRGSVVVVRCTVTVLQTAADVALVLNLPYNKAANKQPQTINHFLNHAFVVSDPLIRSKVVKRWDQSPQLFDYFNLPVNILTQMKLCPRIPLMSCTAAQPVTAGRLCFLYTVVWSSAKEKMPHHLCVVNIILISRA